MKKKKTKDLSKVLDFKYLGKAESTTNNPQTISYQESNPLKKYYSANSLKIASIDPSMFRLQYIQKEKKKEFSYEAKKAMRIGSAVHCISLTPHLIDTDIFIYRGSKNSNDCVEFCKLNKTSKDDILSVEEYRLANKIARSFNKGYEKEYPREYPSYVKTHSEGIIGISFKDINLQLRYDFLKVDKKAKKFTIRDLKTTKAVIDGDLISKEVLNYRYDLAAYVYVLLLSYYFKTKGYTCDDFVLDFINKDTYSMGSFSFKENLDFFKLGKKKFESGYESLNKQLKLFKKIKNKRLLSKYVAPPIRLRGEIPVWEKRKWDV